MLVRIQIWCKFTYWIGISGQFAIQFWMVHNISKNSTGRLKHICAWVWRAVAWAANYSLAIKSAWVDPAGAALGSQLIWCTLGLHENHQQCNKQASELPTTWAASPKYLRTAISNTYRRESKHGKMQTNNERIKMGGAWGYQLNCLRSIWEPFKTILLECSVPSRQSQAESTSWKQSEHMVQSKRVQFNSQGVGGGYFWKSEDGRKRLWWIQLGRITMNNQG